MPCWPALDGHAIDLGNRSGCKNPVWGYCTLAIFNQLGEGSSGRGLAQKRVLRSSWGVPSTEDSVLINLGKCLA